MIDAGTVTLFNNCFGDPVGQQFAVSGTARLATLAPIAQKAAFHQHGGILCHAQHTEIGNTHSAIRRVWDRQQLLLNAASQFAGVGRVVICLEPTNAAAARIFEVETNENRVFLPVLNGDPFIEWNENIGRPRHDGVELRFAESLIETSCYVQRGEFLSASKAAKRSAVFAAVPSIDNYGGERLACVFGFDRPPGRGRARGQKAREGETQNP